MSARISRRSAGSGSSGGQGVLPGADFDGPVAAGGTDEPLDGPAGAGLDEPGDRERGEHDAQVGVDGLAFAVVDGPVGFQNGPSSSSVVTCVMRGLGLMLIRSGDTAAAGGRDAQATHRGSIGEGAPGCTR